MAITKTKFMNYIRCPKYVTLEDLSTFKKDISYQEYKEEKEKSALQEAIDSSASQLEVMLPYYKQVETLSGDIARKYFDGPFHFADDTKHQMKFECMLNDIRYLCYVDIYNQTEDLTRIIEVKATTSKKFLSLQSKGVPLFQKDSNGIYRLSEDMNQNLPQEYQKMKEKLFHRFDKVGHYIYDIAVQRYIIEHSSKNQNFAYFLAVLNADYEFDGEYIEGRPNYKKDLYGNDIICYFDVTNLTKEYQPIIEEDRQRIENYIHQPIANYPIDSYCEYKSMTQCPHIDFCFQNIPSKNSIFQYLDSHHGFSKDGVLYDTFDLIKQGWTKIIDVPDDYLNRMKNKVQKQVVETHVPYIDCEKIKKGIEQISYPIYHLDFETFPCPLPRFKGEHPYTQSVFQFSLHIESEIGCCDKEKDHYGFLAPDLSDHREQLILKLIEYIGPKGSILVYNDAFEKTRLQELADIFPQYRKELLDMRQRVFDLMNLTKTNTKFYEELGFSKSKASFINYYHEDMNGSYSIKKILPLFSSLTYQGMDIANGVDALVTYALFDKMTKEEYTKKYEKLIEYCKQDTWAMVEILKGLREIVK